MNTSVKAILYTSKTLSNNEHPVMLRLTKDRKSKYISVGFSCSADLWDAKTNLPKKKHPLFKEALVLIQKKVLEASKLVLDLANDSKNLSAKEVQSKLNKTNTKSHSLFSYFDLVIEGMKAVGQIKTSEVYKDTKRNLKKFTNEKDKYFSEIDVPFLLQFEEYLKLVGKGPNTIYIYLRTLRALINRAIKENVCSEEYYAFKKFSLGKYSNIKTAKRAILKSEIQKIEKTITYKKHPKLFDARNLFLFSYYCRGMNYTDMASLTWRNIHDNRVYYTREKTKENFTIELLPPVQKILSHYSKIHLQNKSDFIFPILNETHQTATAIFNRKVKMLRKINKDLKDIASICKIEANLTTYVARHSFATILKRQGVQTSLISEMMGHGSENITQVYLDSFESKVLDETSYGLL